MTLYSADVLDLAKPVTKEKQQSKNVDEKLDQKVEKIKKPPTEKQLAALAKAQETRKRKREAMIEEKENIEKAEMERLKKEAEAEQRKLEKKELQKEKRKAKKAEKEQKVPTPPPTVNSAEDLSLDESIDYEIKKLKKDQDPPVWFKQYVAGVKKEEAKISREKKPKKQIQKEAQEVAQTQWADGFTRDRVRNEVDGHMSRMYQMMFGGRRMK